MWSKYSNLITSNPSEIILDPPLCFYGELQMILFISSLCCGYSLEDPRRTFPIITHNLSMENWRKLSPNTRLTNQGWSGGAKVSCILCHRGVQLILAYSWARPAILVAGKGREVMFLFLLFLHFHSCSSFFPVSLFRLFCYHFCLFISLSLGDDTK